MDLASVGGIVIALVAIIGAMMMEGGNLGQITQLTAAIIVVGGTIGACSVQFPLPVLIASVKGVMGVFLHTGADDAAMLKLIVEFANKARKSGIVSLDSDLGSVTDPFLKQGLMLAVDGTESSEVRKILQLEIDNKSEMEEKIPAVLESAGAFAPTVGIIGAVLGLIQVMQHLDNIDEVGKGIAVAFVATIYGVALANLFCLPAAGKLKIRHKEHVMMQEMMLEGVISILEGLNPRMIETKLKTFMAHSAAEKA